MYGWRGRLGLVLPADNTVVEVDLARRLPEGVSAHVMRLSSGDQRQRMPVEAVEVAPYLVEADIDLIAYLCSASSFLLGPEGNVELVRKLSMASGGLPALTASTAMSQALRAVGASRISVLAPHPPEIAAGLQDYLETEGFGVSGLTALDLGLRAINSKSPGDVYREVRRMDHGDADTVFIAATNLRALEVVEHLESDLQRTVLTSNQVCLWAGLRALGLRDTIKDAGRLLRDC